MIELVGRARFLAAGQDDPHSVTISELCDEIERLRRGNTRMREALEDIADGLGKAEGDWSAIGRFAPAVARKALSNSDTKER